MDNMLDHYQAVLRDLELRRSRVQKELVELEQTIGGIKKLLSTTASLFASTPVASPSAAPLLQPQTAVQEDKKFAGMSVRWGILKLLAEESLGPLKTSQMANRLVNGGMQSGGKDFGGNVSAVVSDMVNKRKELEPAEEAGTYRLTDNGRLAWAAIKHSPRYVNRADVASVQ
jgi:hypothetical protein